MWRRRKIFGEKGGEEQQKRRRREIFGDRKYFFAGEKEKEVNIWSWKIFFCGGEGKGGKYLEQENVFWTRRLNTEKEKEGNVWRVKIFFCGGQRKGLVW